MKRSQIHCKHLSDSIQRGFRKGRVVWNKDFTTSKCSHCKKTYETPKWKLNHGRKFCSRRCYDLSHRVESKCKNCSEIFSIKKSDQQRGRGSFCSQKCSQQFLTGKNHPCWKGGRKISGYGYVLIHGLNSKKKYPYDFEHRIIIEKKLRRKLFRNEIVHHVNGIKTDNRIKNLMVFKSQPAHVRFEKDPKSVKPYEIVFDGRIL